MIIFVWKEASLASGYGAKIVISGLGSSYPPCYSLDFFFRFSPPCKLPNGLPPTSKDFCTMFIYDVCVN